MEKETMLHTSEVLKNKVKGFFLQKMTKRWQYPMHC